MALLDRPTFAALTNRTDVLDATAYGDAYLGGVFQAVQDEIASYLNYDPTLQVHTEEGIARYNTTGVYRGRYYLQLQHAPLVPGPASTIFSSLQLTYALASQIPTNVGLDFVTMNHTTAQVYALSPGAVEALLGGSIGFGYAPMSDGLYATGYTATYAAGYATGVSDPTLPGGVSYGAPPLPNDIRQAALLLVRERLAYEATQNADPTNTRAGDVERIKSADQEVVYRRPPPRFELNPMGYGGLLAQQAAGKLERHVRRTLITII